MRAAVAAAFMSFSAKLEGALPFMYLDVKCLVTTAIGNLIDPVALALEVPFVDEDGVAATRAEIFTEWTAVKARRDLAPCGGVAFHKITKLHLTPAGMEHFVLTKAAQVDAYLGQRFPEYPDWPADAQLGLLSMAWAGGPSFYFPRFSAAVKAQDFATAALECHMDDSHNRGLVPRNAANVILFQNAAAVLASGADPDVLRWPQRFEDPPCFVLPDLDSGRPPPGDAA